MRKSYINTGIFCPFMLQKIIIKMIINYYYLVNTKVKNKIVKLIECSKAYFKCEAVLLIGAFIKSLGKLLKYFHKMPANSG